MIVNILQAHKPVSILLSITCCLRAGTPRSLSVVFSSGILCCKYIKARELDGRGIK